MVIRGGWLTLNLITMVVGVAVVFFGQGFARETDLFTSIAAFAAVVGSIVMFICLVFSVVPATEAWEMVVQTILYVAHRVAFVPFVVPPTHHQARLWSGWLILVTCVRMNLGMCVRYDDFLKWKCFTLVTSAVVTTFWIHLQIMNQSEPSFGPFFLLLIYEPFRILNEIYHVIFDHAFQKGNIEPCAELSLFGHMALLASMGHYVHIWHLHGLRFNFLDALLFLSILDLLIDFIKRTREFIIEYVVPIVWLDSE